ncbi:MAG: cbb3-type cytochrome oxidase assembly protein CcoS [Pseudomonadota bacterium]|nr:cbb3-type cytochrome oxidase assembly protein CcoS [Pseudomonadota bacterium]
MNGILLLIPLSVALGATFAFLFLRAAREGQFDELDEEGRKILGDE